MPDELVEPMGMELMRFHLERLAPTTFGSRYEKVLADISATSDETIQVLLDLDADWVDLGDGTWSARALEPSASGAAGAAHLKELREKAAGPVSTEFSLEFLVQLLRDSAYEKVHQLASAKLPTGARVGAQHMPRVRVR